MLRTGNAVGDFIYPKYKSGQMDAAHRDKKAFTVFVPNGKLQTKESWACTIENDEGAVVIETREDLALLITALEIAYERVRAREETVR